MSEDVKRDRVFNHIFTSIKRGEYAQGQTLTERGLANELGVSRTPIREAFRQLENIGLVEAEPHRGVRVISISDDHVKQLYDIREVLEGLGARRLAEKENVEVINKLNLLLEQARKAVDSEDIDLLSKINRSFHMEIALGSGNLYLYHTLETLQTQISLFMATSLSQSGRPLLNLEEHMMLLMAIESGDSNLAETTARYHVRKALSYTLKEIKLKKLNEKEISHGN